MKTLIDRPANEDCGPDVPQGSKMSSRRERPEPAWEQVPEANSDAIDGRELPQETFAGGYGGRHGFYGRHLSKPPGAQNKNKRHIFGISQFRKTFTGQSINPFDYEKKYEEDEYGKEWDPNARVWKVYMDEAQIFDLEMTEGWRDTLDVFLVFAGLFSAVGATFLGVSVQALQPDYAQITATLLMEVIAIQRAVASGQSLDDVASSSVNTNNPPLPNSGDRWVNALWFISLALSLCTALIAVLIKQWIQQYTKFVSGTPMEQVRHRQFKYNGLEQWGVPVIIGLMPLLLHASLFLYLAGLVVFLFPLDEMTGVVVCIITVIALLAYLVSNFLPLIFLHCPYTTPISIYAYDLVLGPLIHLAKLIPSTARSFKFDRSWVFVTWRLNFGKEEAVKRRTLKDKEAEVVSKNSDALDMDAVVWLHSMSSNPTVSDIALESASALPIWIPQNARDVLNDKLQERMLTSFHEKFRVDEATNTAIPARGTSIWTIERLARSMAQISPWHYPFKNRPVSNMLMAAGEEEGDHSSTLTLMGHYGTTFVTESDRIQRQAVLYESYDAHPSVWISCLLRMPFMGPMSEYSHDSDQTPPILSLFDLIPSDLFRTDFPMPRSEYVKWSLLIRYMISCFHEPGKNTKLDSLLTTFDKLTLEDRCSPEHRRLTMLVFCHLLLSFLNAELMSPERIRSLFGRQGFFDLAGSLVRMKLSLPTHKKGQPQLYSHQDTVSLVRSVLYRAIQGSARFNVSEASVAMTLLILTFRQAETTFGEDDFHVAVAVMQSTDTTSIIQKLRAPSFLPSLMKCFAHVIEASLAKPVKPLNEASSSTADGSSKRVSCNLETLFREENLLTLYQILALYSPSGNWDDKPTLKVFTQQLLRAATFRSRDVADSFSALYEILYSIPDYERVRYKETHGSVYIHALMKKLEEVDPRCGGLGGPNEDGTLRFAVYRKVRRWKKEDNENANQLQPNQALVAIDRQRWIVEPIQNDLAHIFDSAEEATPVNSPSSWSFLRPWRQNRVPFLV